MYISAFVCTCPVPLLGDGPIETGSITAVPGTTGDVMSGEWGDGVRGKLTGEGVKWDTGDPF